MHARYSPFVGSVGSRRERPQLYANIALKRKHEWPRAGRRSVAILRQMATLRVSDYVFPGERPDRPVAGNTLRVILRRLGGDARVHGFRSAFRDWCGDRTSFPREVAEASLAHRVGDDTERAYRRGDAFEKRGELMQAWANYCEPKTGNVIAIRRRRAK
jgi:integrase